MVKLYHRHSGQLGSGSAGIRAAGRVSVCVCVFVFVVVGAPLQGQLGPQLTGNAVFSYLCSAGQVLYSTPWGGFGCLKHCISAGQRHTC
jgi:hypothetical protein